MIPDRSNYPEVRTAWRASLNGSRFQKISIEKLYIISADGKQLEDDKKIKVRVPKSSIMAVSGYRWYTFSALEGAPDEKISCIKSRDDIITL